MKICHQCNTKMEEGYKILVNTYGNPYIEKGEPKPNGIKVYVCPNCNEISLSMLKISKIDKK